MNSEVETRRFVDCSECGDPIVDTRIQRPVEGLVVAKCANPSCRADVKAKEDYVKTGYVSFDPQANRWSKL
jgi:hypothetical protein